MKKFIKSIVPITALLVLALTLCGCSLLGIGSANGSRPTYYLDINTTEDPLTAEVVANNIIPSCVRVISENSSVSAGSGFFINNQGYLLTNRHCVAKERTNSLGEKTWYLPSNSTFTVVTADRKKIEASVVYFSSKDDQYDLAVLKLKGINTNAEYLKFADLSYSKTSETYPDKPALRYGQSAFTVGNPNNLGLLFARATIASPEYYLLGTDSLGNNKGIPSILLDASINHGNSGGALVDTNSAVIGIVYARMEHKTSENGDANELYGIGCAMPSYVITKFLDDANVKYSYAPASNQSAA